MSDIAMAIEADPLASARRVLMIESRALADLADAIDGRFEAAVDLLLACRGRVVVSGMGKSGHVARKIAATFASTGAPAQFVHPAEASHGDLGMIACGDAALVLSNSGETPELADLIAHTRRQGIPLIGIASRARSTLLRAADVALVLPPAPEACPLGLAPTTSTTMALALGDALAVALMERRGFRPESFGMLHPGGTLGARLLKVEDLMHGGDALPLVAREAPMAEAILTITRGAFGVAGVVDGDGALIGAITDGDLRRHMEGLLTRIAGDVMSPAPKTIRPGALAQEALALMNTHRITSLFVVPSGVAAPTEPVGLIHVHDCLRAGLE